MGLRNLTVDEIIWMNEYVLHTFPAKRADRHEVLNYDGLLKLMVSIQRSHNHFYAKATMLLIGLIRGHFFASGNRRTALQAVGTFATLNRRKVYIWRIRFIRQVLIGIREQYYSDEEIKMWVKQGDIRPFNRFQTPSKGTKNRSKRIKQA
jgi:prophage maintenance system killer protein